MDPPNQPIRLIKTHFQFHISVNIIFSYQYIEYQRKLQQCCFIRQKRQWKQRFNPSAKATKFIACGFGKEVRKIVILTDYNRRLD